ncbi:MAG: hypothetical protein LBS29_06345 [Endomicrobium sp.]|jgi:hypothetical protein|nr:hypothetical protein [Endomicrobium sp.]
MISSKILFFFDILKRAYAFTSRYRAVNIAIICSLSFLYLLPLAMKNITDPDFWADEIGTFWAAKGIWQYGPPLSAEGNLWDVFYVNYIQDITPVGFHVLLRIFLLLGSSPIVLRTLPFIFLVLSIFLLTRICYIWYPKKILNWLGGFVLLWGSLQKFYAFELRPYSMEMFSVLVALYISYRRDLIFNNKKIAFIYSVFLSICLLSRYSAVISIAPLFFLLFFDIIAKRQSINRHSLGSIVLFGIPLFITALYNVIIVLHQVPSLTTPYALEFTFKGGGLDSILLGHKEILLFPLILLTILFIFLRNTERFKRYNTFVIYALCQNGIFIILSLLGKYPWGLNSRFDIATNTIFIVSIIPLLFILLEYFSKQYIIKLCIVLVLLIVPFLATFNYIRIPGDSFASCRADKPIRGDTTYYNYIASDIKPTSKILANFWASSTLRYLFEYGRLRGVSDYPDNLFFFDFDGNIYPSRKLTTIYLPQHGFKFKGDIIGTVAHNLDDFDYVILDYHCDIDRIRVWNNKINLWQDITRKGSSVMFKKEN